MVQAEMTFHEYNLVFRSELQQILCNNCDRPPVTLDTARAHDRSEPCLSLYLLRARRPLLLQVPVQALRNDVRGPPLAPAGQEDAVGVLGQVVAGEGAQDALRARGERLGVGHVHGRLEAAVPAEPRAWDQAGRHRDDDVGARELAPPPVRAQQLDEFGIAVDDRVLGVGACQQLLLEDACHSVLLAACVISVATHPAEDSLVSGTLRTAPDDTTTTRVLDSTSFSRSRWVR